MGDVINCFPGYEYKLMDDGKYHNMYRGTDVGRGGYVYSEPGIYGNVTLLDVQNMHGESIERLKKFGEHTKRFAEIRRARNAIKVRDFDTARSLLDGKLAPYLDDESMADQLANALKLILNSTYGIAAATFDNPLRDPRDVNNIIALRGALFMRTLQDEVVERGFQVIHIKTDSIKIPEATPEIIQFCMDFAQLYGYKFEHEATYERICLIDKAQYVAAYMRPEKCEKRYGYIPGDNKKHFAKHDYPWTTTGDAFQHPYIFKTLFSGEPIEFKDRCEIKTVKDAAMYLDFNEGCADRSSGEKEWEKRKWNQLHPDEKPKRLSKEFEGWTDKSLSEWLSEGHCYQFVGRAGSFFPVRPGVGGGQLVALRNGKYNSVSGAKGFRWFESIKAKALNLENDYDPKYFDDMIEEAIGFVNTFGSFDRFVDLSRPYIPPDDISPAADDDPPWSVVPCGDGKFNTCMDCPNCVGDVCKRGYSLANYFEGA